MVELRKAFAIVVAAAVAASPVVGTAHLTAVAHAVCPRDGELVEIHSPRTAVTHDAPRSLARHAFRAATSQAPEADHGHAHCASATHLVPRIVATSRVAATSALPHAVAKAAARRGIPAVPGVDLYLLAPKNSPPA
jgi:hypothetical protein